MLRSGEAVTASMTCGEGGARNGQRPAVASPCLPIPAGVSATDGHPSRSPQIPCPMLPARPPA